MNWFNDARNIFEKELLEFFIEDKYKHIIFPGHSGEICNPASDEVNFGTASHTHSFAEVVIVLEGPCVLESEGVYYQLEKGDIGIVDGKRPHRERAVDLDTKYQNAYISFEENRVWFFLTRYNRENGFECIFPAPTLIVDNKAMIRQMQQEIQKKSADFEAFFYSFLKAFYLYIHKNKMLANSENISIDRISSLIITIEQYVKTNYKSRSLIKDMCQHLHLSESALCNFVKKYMNTTLSHYINKIRIGYARDSLLKSDKKISDIAIELGYIDQFYFSKVFRSYTGMTPTEYRSSKK